MKCIPVWNRCNNKCLMCSNPPDYPSFGKYDFASLKTRIDRIRRDETHLYLTGGEPSLSPVLLPLLAYIRGRLPRTRILIDTNGRMFAYRAFAAKCAAFGNIEFQVSLCGHTPSAHDGVTRTPGSFRQAMAGIKNLLRLKTSGMAVEVRFVLSGLSLSNIGEVYKLAAGGLKGIDALVLIFMEMEGHAALNLKAAGLTYTRALGPVEEFFSRLERSRDGTGKIPFEIKLYHFPLCTLPPRLWKYAWRTLPGKEVTFPESCSGCAVKKLCLGVHKDYLKHFGASEFKPLAAAPRMRLSSNFCHPVAEVRGA